MQPLGLEVDLVGAEAAAGVPPHAVARVPPGEVDLEAQRHRDAPVEDRGRPGRIGTQALLDVEGLQLRVDQGAVQTPEEANHLAVQQGVAGAHVREHSLGADDSDEGQPVIRRRRLRLGPAHGAPGLGGSAHVLGEGEGGQQDDRQHRRYLVSGT
ncbi:MAG: hypothetical protein JRI25_27845 [Deltaproteobacteria bacterium]|nr:hypothetical protein [Deltaproteobacteria bacterium]